MNLEALRRVFLQNLDTSEELGASVSVWRGGIEMFSLGGGFQDLERSRPWTSSTPVLVWSATKGVSAACFLHALEKSDTRLETPVRRLWPEFAAGGKSEVTLRMVLQHQAGLSALSASPPVEDYLAVVDALAKQVPAWKPGTAHGYHPRTFGFLLQEILHRLGWQESIGAYWRKVFAEPLNLDFWIGLPEHLQTSVAPVFSPRGSLPKEDPFLREFMTSGSLTSRSFASPKGLHSAVAMNHPAARSACYPGFGGIGTASALAKFYAMLATEGTWEGRQFFKPETLRPVSQPGVQGLDLVLCMESAFSCGFMRDPLEAGGCVKKRSTFGPNPEAFGHPGAGGSLAFADPKTGTGFAYVMNQMAPGVLPNRRATGLVDALFQTL